MNQGIITSLFGLSSIFSAAIAYFIFGDKLKIYHVIGMIMMLLCIVGLGVGSTKKIEINEITHSEDTTTLVYSLLAILLGICCPLLFALSGLTVRYHSDHYNFKPVDMTISGYYIGNTMLAIALIFTYHYGSHPFIFSEYIQITISGLIGAMGEVFLNLAVSYGLAGPAFALANIQVIIQTILDAILVGQIPSIIEVASALFGVIG
mmetsp:Transcript_8858/g.7835  ORF Transcript_8858/g.7835 Transcript_8858/m.7835 type:complete len:206 (+) Transcript_8858:491-1108(+)